MVEVASSEFRTTFSYIFGIVWISAVWISDIHCNFNLVMLDDDDEDDDGEVLEESPCGRYLKRREQVSFGATLSFLNTDQSGFRIPDNCLVYKLSVFWTFSTSLVCYTIYILYIQWSRLFFVCLKYGLPSVQILNKFSFQISSFRTSSFRTFYLAWFTK